MKASERETRTAATRRRKDRVCFAILRLLLDVQGRKRGFDQDRGCWIGEEAGSCVAGLCGSGGWGRREGWGGQPESK